MARKMTRGARIAQIQVNKLLAASATPPTPDPVPYAETLAFLERVAADFAAHADHDPVSADTVTYCRVAAAAVQAFRKAVPTPTAGEKGTHAQPVGRWEEAPRYVWICLCGVRWNSSVADCSKCRSVRPETAAAPAGETVCSHGCVQDECEVCAEFDIKMGEAVMGCLALRENAEDWMPATLRKHADALNELLQQMRALHVRDIAAARVLAPSAPQEPRGGPSEGMAALDAARVALTKVWHGARHTDAHHELLRDAFKSLEVVCAALSTGGRDAD